MIATPKVKSMSPTTQHFCIAPAICRSAFVKCANFAVLRSSVRMVGKAAGQLVAVNFKRVNSCGSHIGASPIIIGSYKPIITSMFAQFAIESNSELSQGDFLYKTKDGLLAIELTTDVPHCLAMLEDTFAIPMNDPESQDSSTSIMIGV